jgi:hypothetical protein
VSIDQGENWQMFDADFPRVAVHDLFVQERDNDLLVGTHGRSIYLLELEAVQELPTVTNKAVAVLAPKTQKHKTSWGQKRRTWDDAKTPDFWFTFFAKNPTVGTWHLISDKNVVLFEEEVELTKGLQQVSYDLIIQEKALKKYSRKHKTEVKPADDGRVYLPKGSYQLLWNDEPQTTLKIE